MCRIDALLDQRHARVFCSHTGVAALGPRWRNLDDTALRALGYAPRTPFAAGLSATVQWYRQNRHWWEPLRPPATRRQRIYN